jgi:hypothetical protein
MTEETKKRYFVRAAVVTHAECEITAASEEEAARLAHTMYRGDGTIEDLLVQEIDGFGYASNHPKRYMTDDFAMRHEPRFQLVQRFTLSGLDEPLIIGR